MKILWVLVYPFNFLRKFTIPYYTEMSWNRTEAVFMPFFTGFFVVYSQTYIWQCSLRQSKKTVLPSYNWLLTIVSFMMSVLWICSICEIMINLLSLFGILLNLPISILGLTMLAWGNSAGDFCANPAIAKLGMAETAVTACFAGPLFNTLIGFGISLIVACTTGNITFHILDHYELLIAASYLLFSSLISIYFLVRNNGNVRSFHGKAVISLYFLFFSSLITYSFF